MSDISKIKKGGNIYNIKDTTAREQIANKADKATTHTKQEVDDALKQKQDALVSGTNIKTVNGQSILGAGNIVIEGGAGGSGAGATTDTVMDSHTNVPIKKLFTEINVSELFPTGGIDGSNKYTLEGAIAKIPTEYRRVGIKCTFIDNSNLLCAYEFQGGVYTDDANWLRVDNKQFASYKQDIYAIRSQFATTAENGLYFVDDKLNVAMKFDSMGLDTASISPHMQSLISDILPTQGQPAPAQLLDTIETTENGLYFVDDKLNVGGSFDANGVFNVATPGTLFCTTNSTNIRYCLLYRTDFTISQATIGADWTNTDWAISNGGLTPTVNGETHYIFLNKIYHSDKRYCDIRVYLATDTVLRIPVAYGNVNSGEGASCFVVDMQSREIKICTTGNGTDTQGTSHGYNKDSFFKKSIANLPASGDFLIRIEKDNTISRITLISDKNLDSVSLEHDGWGVGRQNQHYYFYNEAGGFPTIKSISIYSMANPDIVFTGDSITEGVAVSDRSQRYADLYRKDTGKKVVISARGGQKLGGLMPLFDSEWNICRPRVISLLIGANYGNSAELFTQFKAKCDAIGCELICNYRTCQKVGMDNSNTQLIPQLCVAGARFDIATAIDNAPNSECSNPNLSLFAGGSIHPNEAGNIEMYKRLKIDCKHIF